MLLVVHIHATGRSGTTHTRNPYTYLSFSISRETQCLYNIFSTRDLHANTRRCSTPRTTLRVLCGYTKSDEYYVSTGRGNSKLQHGHFDTIVTAPLELFSRRLFQQSVVHGSEVHAYGQQAAERKTLAEYTPQK